MTDGWREVRLEQILTQVKRSVLVTEGSEYPLLGVRWYGAGPFRREVGVGGEIKAKKLYEVKAGDFIYNRLFAWKGSFGVIDDQVDGSFVSGEFPLFVTDREFLKPGYLNLLMSQPATWAQIERESTGSTATSRNRWKEDRFLDWSVLLPPLAFQTRVLDLVDSIDAVLRASRAQADSSGIVAAALIEDGLAGAHRIVTLDDLILGIEAGKSPPAADRPPEEDELAVLKVSAVRPGYFDPSEAKVISDSGIFPEHAVVRSGDLLITRANTRELVGSVCRVEAAPSGYFLCDKTLRLIPDDTLASPDFLLLALQSRDIRRQIADAATGTSASMKNISQASIRSLRLPLMQRSEQDRWVAAILDAKAVGRAADFYTTRLTNLRSALLAELLAGGHDVPDSYDELLEHAS